MPFTAAHPAAVLPLVGVRRLRLDATCLILGSMVPDFEYFIRGQITAKLSHNLVGILEWGLPVTLAVALIFHRVVKWPLLLVAPLSIAERAAAAARMPWPRMRGLPMIASLVASALLGNLTHLGWDAFTHRTGLVVRNVLALQAHVQVPAVGTVAVYRLLQHASTAVGLAIVFAVTVRTLRRQPAAQIPNTPRTNARLLFCACVGVAIGAMELRLRQLGYLRGLHALVGAISGCLAGMLLASVLLSAKARRVFAPWSAVDPARRRNPE